MTTKKKVLVILTAAAGALAAVYLGFTAYFSNHFYFGSTVNGAAASGASIDTVKSRLLDQADDYYLTIMEDGGKQEILRSSDVGLTLALEGDEVDDLLEQQNAFGWIAGSLAQKEYVSESISVIDDAKLRAAVDGLVCVTDITAAPPVDAHFAIQDGAFEVVPESEGTVVDSNALYETVREAMISFKPSINIREEDDYVRPSVYSDDERLNALVANLNQYLGTQITYETGDVVGADTVASFLVIAEDGSVSLDETKVSEYVDALAEKYDTVKKPKTLLTSYGQTVTVPNASYGWQIDKEAEKAKLLEEIQNHTVESRDIIWKKTAASHGENDYGNSYVEVNLTAQHMFLYVDGQQVLDSPVVTGNVSKGHSTPPGAFPISYCQRDAVLRGDGYESPVSYWMPFNGGIGLHDANWRGNFGGGIYLTNGSHGCVNLPVSVAPKIFERVSKGFPVLVYELPGTGSYSLAALEAARARGAAYVEGQGAAADKTKKLITSIGTVTLLSEPVIVQARNLYNSLSEADRKLVTNYQVLVDSEAALAALKGQGQPVPEQPAEPQTPPAEPQPAPAEPAPAPAPEPAAPAPEPVPVDPATQS